MICAALNLSPFYSGGFSAGVKGARAFKGSQWLRRQQAAHGLQALGVQLVQLAYQILGT